MNGNSNYAISDQSSAGGGVKAVTVKATRGIEVVMEVKSEQSELPKSE